MNFSSGAISKPLHFSTHVLMTSLRNKTPHICQNCTRNLLYRPKVRQGSHTTLRQRNYSESRSGNFTDTHNGKLANSDPTVQTSDAFAATSTSSEPIPSSSEADADFRLAKHFNRDPKLKGRRNMRAPYSALEVKLSDGNYMGYSRHRIPASASRTRPIYKVQQDVSESELESSKPESSKPESTKPESTKPESTKPEPSKIEFPRLEPSPPSTWLSETARTHIRMKSAAELHGSSWYWETLPPTIGQKTQATKFFVNRAKPKFLRSMASFRAFPESSVPEVAFVGRSNVGKSSLLNAVVNADTNALLAKTSSTPGFTKTMNLYGVGPGRGVNIVKRPFRHETIAGTGGISIVDMPGYGEGSLSEWGIEIMKYIQCRKQLRRVFVLLDVQHGMKDKDRSILASLRLGGISHQIILSKLDKIYLPKEAPMRRVDGKPISRPNGYKDEFQHIVGMIRNEIQPSIGGGALGEILGCSTEVLVHNQRLGIDAIRFAILQAAGIELDYGVKRTKSKRPLIRPMTTTVPGDRRALLV
jgi:GTP-binding protein